MAFLVRHHPVQNGAAAHLGGPPMLIKGIVGEGTILAFIVAREFGLADARVDVVHDDAGL